MQARPKVQSLTEPQSVRVPQQDVGQLPASQIVPDPLPVCCDAEAECHLCLQVHADVGGLIT